LEYCSCRLENIRFSARKARFNQKECLIARSHSDMRKGISKDREPSCGRAGIGCRPVLDVEHLSVIEVIFKDFRHFRIEIVKAISEACAIYTVRKVEMLDGSFENGDFGLGRLRRCPQQLI